MKEYYRKILKFHSDTIWYWNTNLNNFDALEMISVRIVDIY